jgi:hypothetical protein
LQDFGADHRTGMAINQGDVSMIAAFTQRWNERLGELHEQETQEYRQKISHLDRLNQMVCESNEQVREELRRAGYLL